MSQTIFSRTNNVQQRDPGGLKYLLSSELPHHRIVLLGLCITK